MATLNLDLSKITRNLKPGDTGADVEALQRALIGAGFSIPALQSGSAPYGTYADQTKAAVSAWQAAAGIDTQGNPGYFGPISQNYLRSSSAPQPSIASQVFTPPALPSLSSTTQTSTPATLPQSPTQPKSPIMSVNGPAVSAGATPVVPGASTAPSISTPALPNINAPKPLEGYSLTPTRTDPSVMKLVPPAPTVPANDPGRTIGMSDAARASTEAFNRNAAAINEMMASGNPQSGTVANGVFTPSTPAASITSPGTGTGGSVSGGGSGAAGGGAAGGAFGGMSPDARKAVQDAEKLYNDSMKLSDEEYATQEELDKLLESTSRAYVDIEDKVIPMQFITGQLASVERRANAMKEPLERKLARLQARRQSAMEASKFSLDRADKEYAAEREARKPIAVSEGASIVDPTTGQTIFGSQSKKAPTTIQTSEGIAQWNPQTGQWDPTGMKRPPTEAEINAKATEPDPAKLKNQLEFVKGAISRAINLSPASGRSGFRKTIEGQVVGSTDYTNLVAETNSLRTIALTLMSDPSVKKFFGPQMSNADVQLMMSAGTTLNPELQNPENMKNELLRLQDLIGRIEASLPTSGSGSAGGEWTW